MDKICLIKVSSKTLFTKVPMLVMKGRSISQPILGYNVIEQIMETNTKEQLDATRGEQLRGALNAHFPNLERENVTAFIEKVTVQKHTSVQIDRKVQTQSLKKDTTMFPKCCT